MLIKCSGLISLKAFEEEHTHTDNWMPQNTSLKELSLIVVKPFIPLYCEEKLKLQHLLCTWKPDFQSHYNMNCTMRAWQHGFHRSIRVCVTEVQWECYGRLALCYCMQITESDSTRFLFCSELYYYNIHYTHLLYIHNPCTQYIVNISIIHLCTITCWTQDKQKDDSWTGHPSMPEVFGGVSQALVTRKLVVWSPDHVIFICNEMLTWYVCTGKWFSVGMEHVCFCWAFLCRQRCRHRIELCSFLFLSSRKGSSEYICSNVLNCTIVTIFLNVHAHMYIVYR